MPNNTPQFGPHFVLTGYTTTERFRSPGGRSPSTSLPHLDRQSHGASLRRQLAALEPEMDAVRSSAADESDIGLQVEFESFPDIDLAFESLARERSGIELRNVRSISGVTLATVFVPDGKLELFERMIEDYLSEKRGAKGQVLDHKRLLNTIRAIRVASIHSLWTDTAAFPADDDAPVWWEIWLPVRSDRWQVVESFSAVASECGIPIAQGHLLFPERTVVLAYGSPAALKSSVVLLNLVAELRLAKETADFFDSLPPEEQAEWLSELLSRTTHATEGSGVAHVCLLDTGVNSGHPFIKPALADPDLHTIEPAWGTFDDVGHGTEMAGLALAGDLTGVSGLLPRSAQGAVVGCSGHAVIGGGGGSTAVVSPARELG